MKLFIIIFFIPFTLLFSQDQSLFNLYEKYIPEYFSNSDELIFQVNDEIKDLGKLHPDLIYYYLEHLNLKYNKNIQKPDSNYLAILESKENKYKKQKNDFALRQKELIIESSYPQSKKDSMLSCINNLFIEYEEEKIFDVNIEVDTNKQNYYTFLYYSGRKIKYDSGLNFELLVKEEIENKVKYFNTKKDNLNNLNEEEQLVFVDEMNKYWYIFDPEVEPITKIKFNQSVLAQEIYRIDYLIEENFRLEGFYLTNKFTFFDEINNINGSYRPSIDTSGQFEEYSTSFSVNHQTNFTLFAGYRLKIKKEYDMFSYIDLSIGFSKFKSEIDTSFGNQYYDYFGVRAKPGYRDEIYAKAFLSNGAVSSFTILSKAVIPVYYINKMFHFKVGIMYQYFQTEINYDVNFEEKIVGLDYEYTNDFSDSKSYTKTHQKLFGIISANAAYEFIELILEANFSNEFIFSLGMAINI